MKKHLSIAKQETAPVLQEAAEMVLQKEQVETKEQLLTAFKAHFIMSSADIAVLTSNNEPVNDKFFSLLARAKQIQKDCEVLLGTENQRLGQDIMEQTTSAVNQAFHKLFKWIQREFKSLNLENPQITHAIRRALRVLAERPSLFQSCLDHFAEARDTSLSDSFMTALTGLSSSGRQDNLVKPLDLNAHDPLRYVGDILAWVHSVTVSEKEALEAVFISEGDEMAKGIQTGRENEPWNAMVEEAGVFDGVQALNDLVDRDVAGVAKLLRQRIGQVVQSHPDVIVAYKLANVLRFYLYTFSKVLGKDSMLLESLETLKGSALKQFRILVRDQIDAIKSDGSISITDPQPPEFLQDALGQLSAIVQIYESSFTAEDNREADFVPILEMALEPFVSHSIALGSELPIPAKHIFTLNCCVASRTLLAPYDFVSGHLMQMSEAIDIEARILVQFQHDFLRNQSGLHNLILAARSSDDSGSSRMQDLRQAEAFQPANVRTAGQALDDFLPSALMDARENLKDLQSSEMAQSITAEAAQRFCEDFERIEEIIIALDESDAGQAGTLREALPRTRDEIRVLLS